MKVIVWQALRDLETIVDTDHDFFKVFEKVKYLGKYLNTNTFNS